jgi:predicted adenylyl cyclase CyaB
MFVLDDQLKDQADLKAFVDIGTHGRVIRRLQRDIKRTGQKLADILKYFAQVVEPMHEKYVEDTKRNADLIIDNEYQPSKEAERSGQHEIQLKFAGTLDSDVLRALGAEMLGSTHQVDEYYQPSDRDLAQTQEIMRIRNEGEHKVLTYKGPKIDSEFRERPKLEFEIDSETREAFGKIYGAVQQQIVKERSLYQLDGIVFSLDKVRKVVDGREIELGDFVELRTTDGAQNQERVMTLMSKLGLDVAAADKRSYVEM